MPPDDPVTYTGGTWWPCVEGGRVTMVISTDALKLQSALRVAAPRLSNHGFISALKHISRVQGKSDAISASRFNAGSREFRRVNRGVQYGVPMRNPTLCPCCAGSACCRYPQTDADMKLVVLQSPRKDSSDSHFFDNNNTGARLFLPKAHVQLQVDKLMGASDEQGQASCGGRKFKALQPGGRVAKLMVTGTVSTWQPFMATRWMCWPGWACYLLPAPA